MKNIRVFNIQFLEVKFSLYLNGHIFVMNCVINNETVFRD